MREWVRATTAVVVLAGAVSSPAAAQAPASEAPFFVTAVFEPATREKPAQVALRFSPSSSDLKVNRRPAPRLELSSPGTLALAPAPPSEPPADAGFDPQYLSPDEAYRLPVTLATGAKGAVDGQVVFFYCSKAAGWCKKGTAAVTLVLPASR